MRIRIALLLLPLSVSMSVETHAQQRSDVADAVVQPSQAATALRLANAGATARTVADLSAAFARECRIEPWEVAIRRDGPKMLRLERSATLDKSKANCVRSVVNASSFRIANERDWL